MSSAQGIGIDDRDFPPVEIYSSDVGGRSQKVNGEATGDAHSLIYDARRLADWEMKQRTAIVQGLGFDEGAVGALVGEPNTGKTALAVSLSMGIATRAERWLGLKVTGGPALYFGSEAPGSVIMRAKAVALRLGVSNPPFYVCRAVPGLGGESASFEDAQRIIETAHKISSDEGEPVRIICIDTLAACLADGDENGDGMIRLVGAAQRIALTAQCFVLLVHHPAKGAGGKGTPRGHGSLAAACDSIVRVETEELTRVRVATLEKARDCATGLQLRYELEQVILDERDSFGDPRSTIVVKPTTQEVARPRPGGQRQQQLLGELERRYRTGERSWDKATICKAGRELGIPRNSPADALRGLISAGFVVGSDSNLILKYPPEDAA